MLETVKRTNFDAKHESQDLKLAPFYIQIKVRTDLKQNRKPSERSGAGFADGAGYSSSQETRHRP